MGFLLAVLLVGSGELQPYPYPITPFPSIQDMIASLPRFPSLVAANLIPVRWRSQSAAFARRYRRKGADPYKGRYVSLGRVKLPRIIWACSEGKGI